MYETSFVFIHLRVLAICPETFAKTGKFSILRIGQLAPPGDECLNHSSMG